MTPNASFAYHGLQQLAAALVLAFALASGGAVLAAPAPDGFSGLAKKAAPSVVWIAVTQQAADGGRPAVPELPFAVPEGSPFEKFFRRFGEGDNHPQQPRTARSLGSGLIVDPEGYIVTNNHVVADAARITVRLEDDSEYEARLVGADRLSDLALLKIEAHAPLTAVEFGDSDETEVGDWVMAVGNPFGLGGTVTAGIVSARGRNIEAGPYDDFLQIDAPINKGNSGGPLFNMDGTVIGVNTAIFSPNGGSVGIGFAIPSNTVAPIIAQLREKGSVERGWLGVQIQEVTPEIADALGLDHSKGALVSAVIPDSPAKDAELRAGDVIAAVDGEPVEGPRELALRIAGHPAGSTVALSVWRDGAEGTVEVVTARRQAAEQLARSGPKEGPADRLHSDMLGAELATLTTDRRARAKIAEELEGVLVLGVDGDAAREAGLRRGDVIRRAGGESVTTPERVDTLARQAADDKKPLLLLVNRQGRDLFVGLRPGIS